jgi:GTP-binding protein YchF
LEYLILFEEGLVGFNCGIIGLPNSGKSTIFNALSGSSAAMASYPFCTIEPNKAIVPVPDERLEKIGELTGKKNPIPTRIEFVDVAGLVKGASQGEGLGNKFLSHIRNVDALIHVVRLFIDDDVMHVMGAVDPLRDIDVINTELILSDIDVLTNVRDKLFRAAKSGDKKSAEQTDIADELLKHLNRGTLLKNAGLEADVMENIKEYNLITDKPSLYLINSGDGDIDQNRMDQINKRATDEGSPLLIISGKTEEEISELPENEREDFRKSMGIPESGLRRLIGSAYRLLDLITFYTMATDLQAWTIRTGTRAPEAAGKIHTDFMKGFIRAEVIRYEDLLDCGSVQKAHELGILRSEGRDYVVKDGDVVRFLFNV